MEGNESERRRTQPINGTMAVRELLLNAPVFQLELTGQDRTPQTILLRLGQCQRCWSARRVKQRAKVIAATAQLVHALRLRLPRDAMLKR